MKTYAKSFGSQTEAEELQRDGRCNVCKRTLKVQQKGGRWMVECTKNPYHLGIAVEEA